MALVELIHGEGGARRRAHTAHEGATQAHRRRVSPRIAILGIHLESNAFCAGNHRRDFRRIVLFRRRCNAAEAAKPAPSDAR